MVSRWAHFPEEISFLLGGGQEDVIEGGRRRLGEVITPGGQTRDEAIISASQAVIGSPWLKGGEPTAECWGHLLGLRVPRARNQGRLAKC